MNKLYQLHKDPENKNQKRPHKANLLIQTQKIGARPVTYTKLKDCVEEAATGLVE